MTDNNAPLEKVKDPVVPPRLSKELILADVAEVFGIETAQGKAYLRIAVESALLMDKKNRDYGTNNISKWGTQGIIVRMSDKFERLCNLFMNRRKKAVNESIRDNLQDIHVYAGIALLVDRKEWPPYQ